VRDNQARRQARIAHARPVAGHPGRALP
jgi:hypothetical protein